MTTRAQKVGWLVAAILCVAPVANADAAAKWLSVGWMSVSRSGHGAAALTNGRVLVMGGFAAGLKDTASTEIFDPTTRVWNPTASMHDPRHLFSATRLKDGKVLVAGGYDDQAPSGFTNRAELYDPSNGTWSSVGDMHYARGAHTATLLPDGRVLVVGGSGPASATGQTAEIFDPATRSWTMAAPPLASFVEHVAELLDDGSVLVAEGAGNLRAPERYFPASDKWKTTSSPTTDDTASRRDAISAVLNDGSVLLAGGVGPTNSMSTAEVYDAQAEKWTRVGDTVAPRWTAAASRLAGGDVLVEGGWASTGALASAEIFDHMARTWSPAPSMFDRRLEQTSTLLPDGSVLVTGGYDNRGTYWRSAEIYVPNDPLPPTSTAVACSPQRLIPGQPTTCAATVTDTSSGTRTTPTGKVAFTTSGRSCTLAQSNPGTARCSTSYTAGATPTPPHSGRTDEIFATYSGDPTHGQSTGMTPVEVFGDTCARDYGVDATNLYSQTISRATPRAYYRLQEQSNGGAIPDGAYAHDWLASSSQTVGTFHGNVRGGAEGALRCGPDNFAVTFDADGSSPGRVTLQTLNSVGDFTIEGWSYLTEGTNGGPMNPNGNATLFGAYGSERLLIRPRGVYGDIMIGGVKYIVETTLPSNTGGWHYWAFVRSGNTLTLYRDAKAVGSRTGVPTSTIPLRGNIGEQTNGTYPFQGALDEIALYTRAVPASEVSEHYNAATPQAPPDTAG